MINKSLRTIKDNIFFTFSSTRFRLFLVFFGYISFITLTKLFGRFNFFIGYFYLTLISLSGFWFGIRGGVFAATFASVIFVLELNFYRYWPFRDLMVQTLFLRIFFYFLGGISMGYVSGMERKLKDQLKTLAYYDELTGCVNFRWIMYLLRNEIARAKRYNKEVTISMIDIDHFKKINDKYGHLIGNDVLREFTSTIKDNVRTVDIVGRYGGEEFLVILPEATVEQSLVVLERIKTKLAETAITSHKLKIKFSAGIASFPYNGENLSELLALVDNALYQAKKTGRDKIVIERRRWLRVKPVEDFKIELTGLTDKRKRRPAEIKNISKRGILLLFPYDVPEENFLCSVYFPKETRPSDFLCRVVHKRKLENSLYSVGVFFVDISFGTQEKFLQSFAPLPEEPLV